METMNTKKKKGWIGIFALAMALVVALAACNKGDTPGADTSPEGTANESAISSEELTNSGEESTEDATDTSGETDETTSLEGPESTSEDIPEDESEDGDTTESAVPDDTEEVTTEPEETTEEAAPTLPEETTEEAETTKESGSGKTEPASTTKEKETTKAQGTTPGATTTAPPETTKAGTNPTQPTTTAPPPTTTAAPTQPAHTHSYTSKVTKQPTCGAAGVKTYTCSGCGHSYTEPIPATGNHNWVEQFKTVHHDAITRTIHHDAETHIVHHDAVTHQQWVTDQPAYDENVYEWHDFCNQCHADLSIMKINGEITAYIEHLLTHPEGPGYHAEQVVISVIHHDEVGHYETVVDTPAWDETVIDKPAWDEVIVEKEAWDETVHDCYKCSVCGATKP